MNNPRLYLLALWILFCTACVVFFAWYPITDSDIFWHLATAREMLAQGHFLTVDPFSYTPHNEHWVNLHWIFQLLMYGAYSIAGFKGILVCKLALVATLSILIMFALPQKENRVFIAFVWVILAYEARYLILDRPVLITLICIALYIGAFERYRTSGKTKWLWFLIPVQVLWTNSQGLWALGVAILGIYYVGEVLVPQLTQRLTPQLPLPNERGGARFLTATAACICVALSCFINPYGVSGVLYPLGLFLRIDPSLKNIYAYNISENLPLIPLATQDPRLVVVVVLTALLIAVLFIVNRHKLRISHVLLAAAFLTLAIMAQRNILLFFFVSVPLFHYSLPKIATIPRKAYMSVGIFVVCAGLFLVGAFDGHIRMLSTCPKHQWLSPFRFPVAAVNFLKQHPVKGRIFNSIRGGGYLLWEQYPPKQVFIDGRLIIRSRAFFAEYLAILDHPELFSAVAEKFGITHALLPTAIFQRDLPLASFLARDTSWCMLYADGADALFCKRSYAPMPPLNLTDTTIVDSISRNLAISYDGNRTLEQESLVYWRDFLNTVDHNAMALRVSHSIK